MVRPEGQGRFHVNHRITRQHAGAHRFAQPFLHGRDVLARHYPAFGGVLENETAARLQRLQGQHDVPVLPFAAGLAHKFAFHVRHFLAQGFAVGDLRTTNVGLNAKLALHPVDNDLQMQLAHAGDNRLAGLFIGMQTERRIFRRQPLQRDAHFLLVRFGLRLNRQRNHRLRKLHALKGNNRIRIA